MTIHLPPNSLLLKRNQFLKKPYVKNVEKSRALALGDFSSISDCL